MDAFSFKARLDGDNNLANTRTSPQTSSFPTQIGILRLDENFSSGCNDYDATNDFSLTTISNWTLEDKDFTNASICESFDFEEVIQDYPISIITICESELQANFLLENIYPDIPITLNNQSAGPINFREWNFNHGQFISNEKKSTYTLTEPSFFSMQLVVSDGCRMDTIFKKSKWMMNLAPAMPFSPTPSRPTKMA